MTFSERHGYTEVRTIAQLESMDDRLRMNLWNILYEEYFANGNVWYEHAGEDLTLAIWTRLLSRDLADFPDRRDKAANTVRQEILSGEWFGVYDLLEVVLARAETQHKRLLTVRLNSALGHHLAGYRVLDGKVAPVTDLVELAEVDSALALPHRFAAARSHLDTALTLFADRTAPDYANSIKESISAVESMVRVVTGKADFHGAIDTLQKSHDLHPKIVLGWKNLYGFTSDEAGVRHGGPTPPAVTQETARYFLITCSAFVNLLAAKAA